MDVSTINSIPYSIPRSVDSPEGFSGKAASAQATEVSFSFEKRDSMSEKVREQVIMNLEEVQNFLYMLIGSKIKVESGNHAIGSSVNTAV